MPENMMNSDHKATNKKFRDNYDRIFAEKEFDVTTRCPNCGCLECPMLRECTDYFNNKYEGLNLGG